MGITWVTRLEETIYVYQWEHCKSPNHGAKLHHRSTPHQGAVTLVTQNYSNDHLHIGQGEDKKDPGPHLEQHKADLSQ